MTEFPDKLFFRPADIAILFDVQPKTVYGWIATGKIPAIKLGGTIRIELIERERKHVEGLRGYTS